MKRREIFRKLLSAARATTAVAGAVSARAVPCHADEKAAVAAEVGGPPILRSGHQRGLRGQPTAREDCRENLVFRELESDRLKASLESFREASKVEVGGAEEGVACFIRSRYVRSVPLNLGVWQGPASLRSQGPKYFWAWQGIKYCLSANEFGRAKHPHPPPRLSAVRH